MALGWKTRVGLVLSAVWLCLVFLVADDYRRLVQMLGLGLLPLVILWGIVWTVAGWRAQRPVKPTPPEADQLKAKASRSLRIRTAFAVVVVLGLGMFAANLQFHAANNESGGNVVARWFGEWCVYGLIAYAILRAVPKLPVGSPAVLAALIVVGSVNYKAYSAIAEDRQAIESLAKAVPLINKIQASTPVSDKEIRDARVGMLEPLVLAQATYNRELLDIAATYEKATGGLQPELMLTPASLGSPNIRVQTRAKLKQWQQATAEYKTQLEAATARGKLAIQAAQSQMPALLDSASKGFDELEAQLSAYVANTVKTDREAREAIVGILDLLDANPGGYVLDKGPPINLLFRDAATLARFNDLMGTMMAANQRQQEGHARFLQAQADRTAKLGTMLKR
jgi:hypothetical protein